MLKFTTTQTQAYIFYNWNIDRHLTHQWWFIHRFQNKFRVPKRISKYDPICSNYDSPKDRNRGGMRGGTRIDIIHRILSYHPRANGPTNLHTPTTNFVRIDKVGILLANMDRHLPPSYRLWGDSSDLSEVSREKKCVSFGTTIIKKKMHQKKKNLTRRQALSGLIVW